MMMANLCLRGFTQGLRQVCTPLLSQAMSRRWHSQDTTSKKIKGFCYLSGHGSVFSKVVDQNREILLSLENVIISKKGIRPADKPNNYITFRVNEVTFLVTTPLVPICLSEVAINDFKSLSKTREIVEAKEKEGFVFDDNTSLEIEGHLEKKIKEMTSELSENALSYSDTTDSLCPTTR